MSDQDPRTLQQAIICETLKRHEEMLRNLQASIEALKSFVIASGGDPFGKIEEEKKRLLALSDPTTPTQV